jgi:glycogen synthase
MKILHVLDHSLPVQSGYAFRSAAILREQARRGWTTIHVTGTKQGRFTQAIEQVGDLSFHRTSTNGALFGRTPVLDQVDVIRLLRRRIRELIRSEQPDLIHAHSPCLNAIAALGLGVPLIYEMRSSWEDAAVSTGTTSEGSLRYRLSRALETYALKRADGIATICEGLRKEILQRGIPADRVVVVPNAVDPDSFTSGKADPHETRASLGLQNACVLGFIGSFFAWEGLALLIEAMQFIKAARPDARLLLVGGGVDEPAMRSAVARYGLEKYVVFAGQVPHAKVAALYDIIDVLVYPRLPMRLTDMVTPLKPLEAMALGKVQIASDVGGHRELIRDGETGVLFRAGDPRALADAALRVMDDQELAQRLRANGPRYVRESRTWTKVVVNYEPLYRMLLGPQGEMA